MFKRGDIFEIIKGDYKGTKIAFMHNHYFKYDSNYCENWGFKGVDKENDYLVEWHEVKHLGFDRNIIQLDDANIDNLYYALGNCYWNGNPQRLMKIDKDDDKACFKFEGADGYADMWIGMASNFSDFYPNPDTAKTISISKTVTRDCTDSLTDINVCLIVSENNSIDDEQDDTTNFLAPQPKPLI